jgi:ornithine carbamoyltransferase
LQAWLFPRLTIHGILSTEKGVQLKGKDLLSIADLKREDIVSLLSEAAVMKTSGTWNSALKRKVLALVFEKPSLRTRLSFELAMRQLGGQVMYLSPAEVGLGQRESVADVTRGLNRFVNVLAVRTFSHATLEVIANYSDIPVINALSDLEHPCQILADLLTIFEQKGEFDGLTLAYVGDGNNVANSLILAAAIMGIDFNIASPRGYGIPASISQQAEKYALESGSNIIYTEDPTQAVSGADIVYTDTWTSMGQESEAAVRREVFAKYQVNHKLLSLAKDDAIVMHCLPAHRGEEVTDDVLDSLQSVVIDQAENRLYVQKALLMRLLGGSGNMVRSR